MQETPVLIIGAGPAGLAVAGRLRHMGIDFMVLEQETALSPAWRRHYDRLHLHTIKKFSELPHHHFPHHYPTYVSRAQLVEYYRDYATKFDIWPEYKQEVLSVKFEKGKWISETTSGNRYRSKAVVVCTGFNRMPDQPSLEGADRFKGQILHSRDYQNPKPFLGQKVLVVGMGNTGAEIALDLAEHEIPTYLSIRGPVNIVPRDLNGRPVQATAKLLQKLPYFIGDWIGRQVQNITIGDLSAYGIQRPRITPARQLRQYAKTPVIDIGTVEKIRSGDIKIVGALRSLSEHTVHFQDGSVLAVDSIILATGYRAGLENFLDNPAPLLNEHGHPISWKAGPTHPNLFFVGFDGYSSGILESIYKDSELVAGSLALEF